MRLHVLLLLCSKSTEAQKIINELTSFTETVNARLGDLSKRRHTGTGVAQKASNGSTTAAFTASAWEASQQQKKQDSGISSYTGWLGFGTSNRPTTNTSRTVVMPSNHQRSSQLRVSAQPSVAGARTASVATGRTTGVPADVTSAIGASGSGARAKHTGSSLGAHEGQNSKGGSGCVDPKLVEMIESEIVDRRPIVQWDDIGKDKCTLVNRATFILSGAMFTWNGAMLTLSGAMLTLSGATVSRISLSLAQTLFLGRVLVYSRVLWVVSPRPSMMSAVVVV